MRREGRGGEGQGREGRTWLLDSRHDGGKGLFF